MKLKFRYSSFLFIAVFNFVFFYEPFFYTANIIQSAGELNPIVSPIIASLIILYAFSKQVGTAIYYLFFLMFTAALLTLINRGITVELFRDTNYMFIVFLLIGAITELIKNNPQQFRGMIKNFIKYFIFLQFSIPIIFSPVIYQENRLPLNNLSDTNSALVLCFMIFSYLILDYNKKRTIWVIGFILVVLSGSRAAFLFYVIGGIIYKDKLLPNIRHQKYVTIATLFIILLFLFFGSNITFDSFRVISLEDVNQGQGSVYSRLNWYLIMYEILSNNWFAGFGGGYAEYAVGKIVHNDLLRFWIDYSIIFPLLLYGFFFSKIFDISHSKQISNFFVKHVREIILLSISLVIMALYNGFQDLNIVISFSLFFSILCYSLSHRPVIKRVLLYK